ncbi:hypothetical protein ACFX2B_009026 [Malus domestica]
MASRFSSILPTKLFHPSHDWAGHSRFIRVMPNTPSAVGAAASVLSLGGGATEQDGDLIAKVFGSIGKTWKANEKYFDVVTGLRSRFLARCPSSSTRIT